MLERDVFSWHISSLLAVNGTPVGVLFKSLVQESLEGERVNAPITDFSIDR